MSRSFLLAQSLKNKQSRNRNIILLQNTSFKFSIAGYRMQRRQENKTITILKLNYIQI